MESPLVSIIVPMYRAQSTIQRCVESICAQTYQNLEIILLNDGSPDGTLACCQALAAADSRVLLVDKPNTGVSDTRNRGLELAHGKYIQFVDSDDWLLPDFTRQLVTAAAQSRADLVVAPYRMVIPRSDASGQSAADEREYSLLPAGVYNKREYLWQVIGQPASFYFGVLWNKLYRRDLLEQQQIRFPNTFYAEDQQFNLAYLQVAEIFAALPDAGYCYLQNPQSVCHTKVTVRDMLQHRQNMYNAYKALAVRLGVYPEYRLRLYGIYTSLFESPLPSGPVQKLSDTLARTHSRSDRKAEN